MADERGLEGHDGPAGGQGGGGFGSDIQAGAEGGEAGVIAHGGSVARRGPGRPVSGLADYPAHMARLINPATLIRRQVVLEEHDPLPDGSGAVVVRRFVHGETYRSHLLLVPFARRAARPAARQLTAGPVRDSNPRVSPDGRRVAFLRSFPDEPDRPTAVMVQAFDSEEPWILWAPEHGVSEIAWSPDGRRMAFVAAEKENRLVVGPETKGRSVTARRITRADWRWNEVGHRDRWDQVWVGAVRRGAKPRQLTRHDTNARSIAWAPDGRSIAYVTEAGPDADIRPLPSIWVVPSRGGAPREAVRLAGYAGSPAFSPDGRWLACSGVDVPDPVDDEIPGLFVAPFDPDGDGPSPAIPLAPDLDLPIGDWNDTDLNGWMASSRPGPCVGRPRGARRPGQHGRPRAALALRLGSGCGAVGRRPRRA